MAGDVDSTDEANHRLGQHESQGSSALLQDEQQLAGQNSLCILGIATRETSISGLLAAALLEMPQYRVVLLRLLTQRALSDPPLSLVVLTEVAIGNAGRIDLLLSWKEGDLGRTLVIEHKLYANESEDQLVRYRVAEHAIRKLAGNALLDAGAHVSQWAPVEWTKLTLFGDKPSLDDFSGVTHKALAPIFRGFEGDTAVARLARDWAALLDDFYEEGAIPANVDVIPFSTAFQRRPLDPLDARYLRFESLSRLIAQEIRVEWHGAYRASYAGRHWYGAHLSCKDWFMPAVDSHVDRGSVGSWIAIQIRLVPPTRGDEQPSITVAVFYETLPYLSRAVFDRRFGPATGAAYKSNRIMFSNELKAQLDPSRWKSAGHWCQVAISTEAIDVEQSWSTVVEQLKRQCVELTGCIERARAVLGQQSGR